jgi:hypothetical protein
MKFLARLRLGTVAGKVKWTSGSSGGMWFEVEAAGGKVLVRSEDQDGDHPYYVEIDNEDGIAISTGETTAGEYYSPWETEIGELFVAARNSALGVDETINLLTKSLDLPNIPLGDDDIRF